MRLIDADELKESKGSYNPIKYTHEYGYVITLDDIDNAPTVDAVEIVRCRNCARAFVTEDGLECLNDGSIVEENDYCLSGESRDGENG